MVGWNSSSFEREYCLVCSMATVGERVDPALGWMATAEEYMLVGREELVGAEELVGREEKVGREGMFGREVLVGGDVMMVEV